MATNDSMNGQNGSINATEDTTAAAAPQNTTLMSSFFPSPPAYFAHFTTSNLELAKRLVSHSEYKKARVVLDTEDETQDASPDKSWRDMQDRILDLLEVPDVDKDRVKDIDLASLVTPPDVELVEEDGHWMAFGQAWPIHEKLPSLEDMCVKQLYKTPSTWEDRRQALHALLHTVLHTYLRLLTILVQGPPSLSAEQEAINAGRAAFIKTEADSVIEHIRLASINIHHLCNEWRPVQAREMLKQMMRTQIDERKAKTAQVHRACEDIKQRLNNLKAAIGPEADARMVEGIANIDMTQESAHGAEGNEVTEAPSMTVKERARLRMLQKLAELEKESDDEASSLK